MSDSRFETNMPLLRLFRQHFELLFWIGTLIFLGITASPASHFSFCLIKLSGIPWCPGCGIGHRRKDPQLILILTLLGFVGVAGVHRMIIGEIGMGLVYFFTAGFCLIGTIIDIINYKNLSGEFNRRQAMESVGMVKQYVK